VPIVPIKVAKLVVEVTTQPIKPTKVPLKYPYIIYSNFERCAPNCPKKIKVHKMFRTKPTTTAIVIAKLFKLDNVTINAIAIVATCNQVPEQ
jgi:hypothetical protein